MLARVVEFTPSSPAAAEFTKIIEITALGIVQAQTGCVAAFVKSHGNAVLGLSIWQSIKAAKRYSRECYPLILGMLRPFLKCDPKVSTFHTRELETGRLPAHVKVSQLELLRYAQMAASLYLHPRCRCG